MIVDKKLYLRIKFWSGILFIILSILTFIFKLTKPICLVLIVIFTILTAAIVYKDKKNEKNYKLEAGGLVALSILEILVIILRSYNIMVVMGIITALYGFFIIIKSHIYMNEMNKSSNISKIVFGIFTTTLIACNIILMINVITPKPAALLFQKLMGANEFPYNEKVDMKTSTLGDGTTLHKDITYDSEYPNNYLDIYNPSNRDGGLKTAVFYLHGGGLSVGDKYYRSNCLEYNKALIAEGYILVQVNYALTPEYTYPIQLRQASEALDYIVKHGEEYGIDTNSIILAGDSAGALLAGQLANIQVNSKYAEKVGIHGVIEPSSIKCVILNSGLVDMLRIDDTDHLLTNFVFDIWARSAFGKNDWRKSRSFDAQLSRVYTNVDENYPPTFITDGNTLTFTDQNEDLAGELLSLDVKVQLNLYAKSEARLAHEYQFDLNTDYAKDNLKKELTFMKSCVDE